MCEEQAGEICIMGVCGVSESMGEMSASLQVAGSLPARLVPSFLCQSEVMLHDLILHAPEM